MSHIYDYWNEYISLSTIVAAILSVILVRIFVRLSRSNLNLPPGPKALPLIGNLHQFRRPPFLTYDKYAREYGKLYYFLLGKRAIIVISSLEYMKTLLSKDSFTGRPSTIIDEYFNRNSGVAFIDGQKWKFHRRLSLQILRDFGMGKSISESIIDQEARELCQYLDQKIASKNNLIETSPIFSCCTMNVISLFTFGERPGYQNKEFNKFMDTIHLIVNQSVILNALPVLFPVLKIFGSLFIDRKLMELMTISHDFVIRKLDQHRQRTSSVIEPTNFVEAYYLAREKHEKNMGIESTNQLFNEWQFVRLGVEFYAAGMDTSSTTLCWATLLLALHDSVREKMTHEIHDIIGQDKIVAMEDRKNFQYSLAVIDEIMRYSSIVPNAIFHKTLEDCEIDGYDIPKKTWTVPCLYSLHHDPDIWEKPNEFHPQHFLSEDGTKYRPREHLNPFGIGKRSCLGESLARIEIFVFIMTLVQRYRFHVYFDHEKGESLEKCLIGSDGIVRAPGAHKICFSKL
jgi:cytochrome P450 family 2 subfamily K